MVCIKQVPNTANVKLDPKYHTLIREGIPNILNPHDEMAVGTALECKSKYGFKVGVVTMGPPQAKDILVDCLKMGVDEAFLLTDERLAGSDTLATSMALSSLIKKVGYKNVFCGQESIDSSTGHLGPSIAEFLHLPQVTHVNEIVEIIGDTIRLRSEYESGYRVIEVKLPAVIAFNKSLKNLKHKFNDVDEKMITILNLDNISLNESMVGIKGSPTSVVDIDIDESSLNFLRVDSSLSAEDRIRLILSGGIVKKKDRIILKGASENIIETLVKSLIPYKK